MEWISVNNDLPETKEDGMTQPESKTILFTNGESEYKGVYDENGRFWADAYMYDEREIKDTTHWMYYPELPKR